MKIDFNQIEEQHFPQFKGGEKEFAAKMYFDGQVRVMQGRLISGASIGMHTHSDSCEVIFITKGKGYIIFNGERAAVAAGDVHYCPKGQTHSLVNDSDEDLCFHAVVPMQ